MKWQWISFVVLVGCAHASNEPSLASRPPHADELTQHAKLTVVTFFSAHCPCQSAHDERLRTWSARYGQQGVRFVAIDSEEAATAERDAAEAKKRFYEFPIVSDPKGTLANELGAAYATYTVILDGEGRIRYEGGLDSDRTHVTDDAELWVPDAIERLLAGKEPEKNHTKAFGCALRRS